MIKLWTGRNGAGKSLEAVRALFWCWLTGSQIYSNIPLFFTKADRKNGTPTTERISYYEDLTELISAEYGVIFMDEAQVLCDCRQWESLPPEFRWKLQQHRKHRLDFYGTTQNIKRVDISLRELVQDWTHCVRLIKIPKIKWRFKNPHLKGHPVLWLSVWLKQFWDDKTPTIVHLYMAQKKDVEELWGAGEQNTCKTLAVRFHLLISFLSKKLYDTYADFGFRPYIVFYKPLERPIPFQDGQIVGQVDVIQKGMEWLQKERI